MPTTGFKTIPGSKLSENATSASNEMGVTVLDINGGMYKYVQPTGALVTGQPVYQYSSTTGVGFRVTPTQSSAAIKKAVGTANNAISASNFGWLQIRGVVPNIKTGTAVTAGQMLIGVATVFSHPTSALYHRGVGFAVATDSGSQLANGFHINAL